MGEAWLRELGGDRFVALSAGAKPAGYVHPLAVTVMQEKGIDISHQQSESINIFLPPDGEPPDLIISVCDSAAENCPVFPGSVKRLHWPFEDPAYAEGTDEEIMACFRRVRDEIRVAIEQGLLQSGE
jgi:arsenate reductase